MTDKRLLGSQQKYAIERKRARANLLDIDAMSEEGALTGILFYKCFILFGLGTILSTTVTVFQEIRNQVRESEYGAYRAAFLRANTAILVSTVAIPAWGFVHLTWWQVPVVLVPGPFAGYFPFRVLRAICPTVNIALFLCLVSLTVIQIGVWAVPPVDAWAFLSEGWAVQRR